MISTATEKSPVAGKAKELPGTASAAGMCDWLNLIV